MAKKKSNNTKFARTPFLAVVNSLLLGDIGNLIPSARKSTARAVNSSLSVMYWQFGKRIREDVLGIERAEYGNEILATLSKELTKAYENGFEWLSNLPNYQILNLSNANATTL